VSDAALAMNFVQRFQCAMQISQQQLGIQQATRPFFFIARHNVARFDSKRQLTAKRAAISIFLTEFAYLACNSVRCKDNGESSNWKVWHCT
jgi:hypothetical protein